jgi:colanic acid biosynthesis glycosyl transferase WcaI
MKILVNDYCGHPFQVQLSRSLARRGYQVLHTYCSSVQTPHGTLTKQKNDPHSFDIQPIELSNEFNKYGLVSRWKQERELGQKMVDVALDFSPHIIISGNTPLGAQARLVKLSHTKKIKFIFWVQDILGVGITKALKKRLPIVGGIIGWFFQKFEQSLLKKSHKIVLISKDFESYIPSKLIKNNQVTVIENWAPLDELPLMPRANAWSSKYGLDDKFCFLYSGTLGLKHNPELLLQLAIHFKDKTNVRIIVISEGLGADFLAEKKVQHDLDNLILIEFQPFEIVPSVLASADVLLAILEPDASIFAVPSKVLTYLCAKKPLLLAVPSENLAARIVNENQAGIVISPADTTTFIKAADKLMHNSDLRVHLAANGLQYAKQTFNIEKITEKFEQIIKN